MSCDGLDTPALDTFVDINQNEIKNRGCVKISKIKGRINSIFILKIDLYCLFLHFIRLLNVFFMFFFLLLEKKY